MNSPMNRAEQDFATAHHDLIYSFLRSRRLSVRDYYDVVVFAYLEAVHQYLATPELHRYAFSTIAFRQMRNAYFDHYKKECRRQEIAPTISIELVGDQPFSERDELSDLLLDELSEKIPGDIMEVAQMIVDGYTARDIAQKKRVRQRDVSDALYSLRDAMLDICCA